MTVFLSLVTGLAAWGIVGSIVVAARDGYRRQPVRGIDPTWMDVPDPAQAGPSDLPASWWLPDRVPAVRPAGRSGPAAGVMLLRPW